MNCETKYTIPTEADQLHRNLIRLYSEIDARASASADGGGQLCSKRLIYAGDEYVGVV